MNQIYDLYAYFTLPLSFEHLPFRITLYPCVFTLLVSLYPLFEIRFSLDYVDEIEAFILYINFTLPFLLNIYPFNLPFTLLTLSFLFYFTLFSTVVFRSDFLGFTRWNRIGSCLGLSHFTLFSWNITPSSGTKKNMSAERVTLQGKRVNLDTIKTTICMISSSKSRTYDIGKRVAKRG